MNIPTPETDALLRQLVSEYFVVSQTPTVKFEQLSRKLERERDEARKNAEGIVADFRIVRDERNELADTLRLLHDYQNGCPLEKYRPEWEKAMADAERLLKKHGK